MDRRRFLATGGMATALLGGFPARLLAADPAVTGSWTAPFNPGDVAASARAVWVDDTTRGTVYRYPAARRTAATGRPGPAITIGRTAGVMAVGDGGVWVADPGTSTVSRISPARDRVDEVVSTPGPATHLTTASHRLWATDGTDSVTVVGTGGRTHTIPVGASPPGWPPALVPSGWPVPRPARSPASTPAGKRSRPRSGSANGPTRSRPARRPSGSPSSAGPS